jgi:TatD DNase family protein
VLIDSHCHLADSAFTDDLAEVVTRARAAGLTRAMCIIASDEPGEIDRASTVRLAWPEIVFATAVHPQHAGAFADDPSRAGELTGTAAEHLTAVAVGEIGLDYHYDTSPRAVQLAVFAAQVEVAVNLRLPVVIHTRDATDDTIAVLKAARGVKGVMHCFSGSIDDARRALDLGFYISLSGIATFPKAQSLREVAAFVPEDRLLVETDAPYLAPLPFRGKRNEPAWVAKTLDAVAEARGVSPTGLADRVSANFLALVGQTPEHRL